VAQKNEGPLTKKKNKLKGKNQPVNSSQQKEKKKEKGKQ